MRTRDKIRIYKKFMAGASVMSLAKDLTKRNGYYSKDWSVWSFTMCVGEVENAIRLGAQAAIKNETRRAAKIKSFSDRYDLGKLMDEWVSENDAKPCGMSYLSALDSLGFMILPEKEPK
jgi:hypothetical protein